MGKKILFLALFIVTTLLFSSTSAQDEWKIKGEYQVKVLEVVDGDTIDVQFRNGIKDTVRLLGIDTPETSVNDTDPKEFDFPDTAAGESDLSDWGRSATEWLKKQVKEGDTVRLEFDTQSDFRGSYNRLLGYIIRDGTNLNSALLRHGLARVYDSTFSLRNRFNAAEQAAKRNGSGVWGTARPAREERSEKKTGNVGPSDVNCSENVYNYKLV